METTMIGCIGFRVYWGHIGIMENKMETTIVGFIGIMEYMTSIIFFKLYAIRCHLYGSLGAILLCHTPFPYGGRT